METQNVKKKVSLRKAINRHLIFGMTIIMVSSLILAIILIIIPSMGLYKRELKHEGAMVTALIGKDKVVKTIEDARNIYYSTPEEIRSDQFSDEYIDIILAGMADDYEVNKDLVVTCGREAELKKIYYTFYDEEYMRAVIAINGYSDDGNLLPGQWVPDESGKTWKEVDRTIDSAWYLPIFYNIELGWTATNFDPIYDSEGNRIGCISTTVGIDALVTAVTVFLLMYIPTMVIIIIWRTVADAKWTKNRVIAPINELAGGARQYAGNHSLDENDRYLSAFRNLEIKTGDEIEELWETMADMEAEIETSMVTIREESAANAKYATELDLARQIQKGALPTDFDEFMEGSGFTLFASMEAAKEVGGDFYDYFRLDEKHMGLVIADVSGKGVPAALFMMKSKALVRNTAILGRDPAETLKEVNDNLCADNPNAMFVTVWFGILNTDSGEIIAANGGHEFPFLTGEDGQFSKFEEPHGIALGYMEGLEYENYSFRIPKGGMLYVYTDGVAEAHNEQDELYDLDRIGNTLNSCAERNPHDVIEVMKKSLNDFKGNRDQFDDITMLAVKYL